MLPIPTCYISAQPAEGPIPGPSKEEVNENLRVKAELFISAVNGRSEFTLEEIFAQGLIWESGYIRGGKDQLIKIYKYNWTTRKGWRLVLRRVNNAYIDGGQFKDGIPENCAKAIVKLVRLDVTQEYDHTFKDGENAKVVDYFPIYLSFKSGKVVRVIFGSRSLAP